MDPLALNSQIALHRFMDKATPQETSGKNPEENEVLLNAFGQALRDQWRGMDADSVRMAADAVSPGETIGALGHNMVEGLSRVSDLQQQSGQLTREYALGGPVELHQVMIAGEKAGIAMDLAMQIRNRLVQAYQEINHMGV